MDQVTQSVIVGLYNLILLSNRPVMDAIKSGLCFGFERETKQCLIHKATITTAADDKYCDFFPFFFERKKV